jgi:hypothetical protein
MYGVMVREVAAGVIKLGQDRALNVLGVEVGNAKAVVVGCVNHFLDDPVNCTLSQRWMEGRLENGKRCRRS